MNVSESQIARALVRHFRRQRPLRGGSLLITILGDSIAPRGGAIALGSLIRLAQPFGLTERLVRTSVARLAHDGWLASRRAGRRSEYSLTTHGRRRFAEATQRIYGPISDSWDGKWTLLLLPPLSAARGEHIRRELRWLGFGELGRSLFAHPVRSVADTRSQLADLGLNSEASLLRASSEGEAHDRRLVQRGWDLAALGRRYTRFMRQFEPVRATASHGLSLTPETAFIVRTLLVHEYRKIHLRDPLLPRSLLPRQWVGTTAYALCRELYRSVFSAAEQYVFRNAQTLSGELRAPSARALRRFGGLRRPKVSAG